MDKYSVKDIESLKYTFKLPSEILDIINELSDLVSAPEYNKTPQFINDKYKKKKKSFEWVNQNFEKTIIKKKEGIGKEIDEIRKYLNKLTEDTSVSICQNIVEKIDNITDNYSNIELLEIGNSMFNIIINNMLFSDIYALLYTKLIHHTFIKTIIEDRFKGLLDMYMVDSNEVDISYDLLCEHNKKLDKNKATLLLYINLMKHDIISKNDIINIILDVQNMILNYINIENKKKLVDELSELLFILVTNSYLFIDSPDKLEEIFNNVLYIANMKVKNRISITNKAIFKHMDLLDQIKIITK